MRALLVNPKAESLFWSLPVSCKLTGSKTISPPLGLITVAALLPQWELRLADMNCRRPAEADWEWAEIVMISATLAQKPSALAVTREAKHRGKTVVLGGPYPTMMPDEVLAAGGDFCVRGEAENTVHLLLSALTDGSRKVVIENDRRPDLSASPVPRFDLLRLRDYQYLTIQTSRGCPFSCEFCDIESLYGRKQRYKKPDQVVNELEALYRVGGRGPVFISDDNFIGSRSNACAILHKLTPWNKSLGEPFGFFTQASVNLGRDEELIDLLTAANFSTVFVGIESPDAEVLENAGKHQNLRDPVVESVTNMNRNGLTVQASFIIGCDGEKEGLGDRICELVEKTNIPILMINGLRALPNTRLWHRLRLEGRLREDADLGDQLSGAQPNFVPSRPEAEIVHDYMKAWDYLYEPSRFLARVYRYYLNMRPTRDALAAKNGEMPSNGTKTCKRSFAARYFYATAFLRLVWRQGIRPSYRRQFWGQLTGILRRNPSRALDYLIWCGMGEDLFRMREMVLRRREL